MKKSKKILWLITTILILFGVVILIWWYSPITRVDTNQLTPQNGSILIRCLTDSHHQLRQTGIQVISHRAEQQLTGLKRTIVRFGISKAFPEEIRIAIIPNPETKVDKRVIVVDFGRGIKLMHLAQQVFTQQLLSTSQVQQKVAGQYPVYYRMQPGKQAGTQPQACAWIDSGLIISNDLNLLTELVSGYRSGIVIPLPAGQPDCTFSINNKNHALSDKIREQGNKLNPQIIPMLDMIDHVEGTLTMQDMDKGTGKIIFFIGGTAPQDQIVAFTSNAEFYKEELQKLVRQQGKEFTTAISTQENNLVMDYQIAGMSR